MPIYMKVDGIDGEITLTGFEGWFDVDSFSWGVTQTSTGGFGGGGGAGRAKNTDLTIMKSTDKGSPRLMLACCTGKHISHVELDFISGGGEKQRDPYLVIKLTDVLVSSFQISGDGGDRPTESVSFNFQRIDEELKLVDEHGQVTDDEKVFFDFHGGKGG